MRSRTPLILVLLALVLVLAGFVRPSQADANEPLRVLFVGNSLTHTNDLPAVVATLARKRGTEIEYETIAPGGFSLEDHWNAGRVPAELASGRWDAVVMQQGPSALPESQVNLREWAERLAQLAREHGTRPALFTVWPERYRVNALSDVIASYANAARAAQARALSGGPCLAAGVEPVADPAALRPGRVPPEPARHVSGRARRHRRPDREAAAARNGLLDQPARLQADGHCGTRARPPQGCGRRPGGSAVSDARRAALSALIDHAPTFPPASLPGPDAIEEDRRARAGEHAWMLARLVWPASRLDELEGEDRAHLRAAGRSVRRRPAGRGGRIALGGGTRRAPRRGVRRAAAR